MKGEGVAMEESYKQFGSTSDVVIRGWRVRVSELALGAVAVVSVVVIIILAALLASAPSSSPPSPTSAQALEAGGMETCSSEGCLRAAAQVLGLLNYSAAPCRDFHAFACGNFPTRHPLSPGQTELTPDLLIHSQNQRRLRDLLEEVNLQQDPAHYEYKLRVFFESCTDHYSRMQQQGKPFLTHILTPAGGWWALQGDSWNSTAYDFHKHLKKVQVDFWTDAFFAVSVTTDWLDWSRNTIQINDGYKPLYYYIYRAESTGYRISDVHNVTHFMRTVGGYLLRDAGLELNSTEQDFRLQTFVTDAYTVEKELAFLAMLSKRTQAPYNHTNRLTLRQINTHAQGAIDFVDTLSYLFRDARVSPNTKVVVTDQHYLNQTAEWINNLHPSNKSRILNNYLVWRLAYNYVSDLSWDYIHANRQLYESLTSERAFQGFWRYCLGKVQRGMGEALSALFVRKHFPDHSRDTARSIADYVRRAMEMSLEDSTHWMTPDTRNIALQKLEGSIFKLGFPDYMQQDAVLNNVYSRVHVVKDDYLGNLLKLNGFQRRDWNDLLLQRVDSARQRHWSLATYAFRAEYYNPWRELIVPAGLMQFPLFHPASPQAANFGSLGSIIGRQLTHAVDQIGNQYLLNGSHYGHWWSSATSMAYQTVRKCFLDRLQKEHNGPFSGTPTPNVNITSLDYLAPFSLGDATGVKLAYQAYQNWTAIHGEDKPFPGGRYTNQQLFFINYAQTACYNRTPLRGLDKALAGRWIQENVRINTALSQVNQFREVFHCKPGDKMAPENPCRLY